ncbi:MAG TPA: NAD-glutamate dehydrogenase, partial [Casimicrobiaceae bacterium]|nr:NAD-glutamate dehydrogenase [Casimicrobiaceae bacterium]
MPDAQDSHVQRLAEVLKLVQAKVAPEKRNLLERFIQQYFSQLDPEDLTERQPTDLYGAALSHWNFARTRDPGSARVRVFNPSIEEHGWQSTHTIIEIVNDDMPFLVDSVAMEVNRHGLTLHLIMHPIIAVKRSADGTLVDLAADDDKDARHESFIRVEVDRIIEPARLDELAADLVRVLDDVRAAVADWKAMRDR